MDELQIINSDTVKLKSLKNENETAGAVFGFQEGDDHIDDKVRMNWVVRKNLAVEVGDIVSVNLFKEIPKGISVKIQTF